MWIICNYCEGSGFIKNNNDVKEINLDQEIILNKPCKYCNNDSICILDNVMLGYLWIDDNTTPISPPNSPR